MRKTLLFLSAVLFITSTALGQEDPVKAMKKATRDLGAYNLDPSNNLSRLQEAKKGIDFAANTAPASNDIKTWIAKGQIYNALAANELGMIYRNPEHVFSDGFADMVNVAANSFHKALGMATKKFETRDALEGLKETFSYLSAYSNQNLSKQEYAKAFPTLLRMLDVHNISLENGGDELLKGEDLDNNYYVTAFCAMVAQENEVAIDLFSRLVERGTAEAAVYSNLFSLILDKDKANALALLEQGKAKFPGNTEILFAEINYYLKEGKLDELVSKLELAIEKEPNNISLYTTLGNVYDNLFQRELEEGNAEPAAENFEKALKYYYIAINKDPAYFDAFYSIGALYYNKAAALTIELKALESDLSREGMRKFSAKEKEVFEFFDKALPYFRVAERINPNDQNTLIALREIYARKNELQVSEEFRKRIERVSAGESNKSYFETRFDVINLVYFDEGNNEVSRQNVGKSPEVTYDSNSNSYAISYRTVENETQTILLESITSPDEMDLFSDQQGNQFRVLDLSPGGPMFRTLMIINALEVEKEGKMCVEMLELK